MGAPVQGLPTWDLALDIAVHEGIEEAARQTGMGRGSIRQVGTELGLELHESKQDAFNALQREHAYRMYHVFQHRGAYDDDIALIKQLRADAGEYVK